MVVQGVRSKPTSKFNAQDLIAFNYDIDLPRVFEDKRGRDLNPKRIQAQIHYNGVSKQVDSFSLMASPLGLEPKSDCVKTQI